MHYVDRVAAAFGGISELAKRLGLRSNAVYQWKARGIPKAARWDISRELRTMRAAGEIDQAQFLEAIEALEADTEEETEALALA